MIRLAKQTQSTADAVVSQTYGIRSVHTSVSQGKSICSNTLKPFFSFSFFSFYFYYLVFCLPSLLFVFLQHSVFSGVQTQQATKIAMFNLGGLDIGCDVAKRMDYPCAMF